MTTLFRLGMQWILLVSLAILPIQGAQARRQPGAAVDAGLRGVPAGEAVSFWVVLRAKARLETGGTWAQRGEAVAAGLQDTAEHTQAGLRAYLDARGLSYRSFWIANALFVTGDGAALAMAAGGPAGAFDQGC
jgi:hypothetical protein